MSNRYWLFAALALICGVLTGTPLAAQNLQPAAPNQTAPEPIKCWWKADKSAVEVGEQFKLTLTCGVSETRDLTAVAKVEQLDPGAVQLAPFEVLGGIRHEDILAPPWRYFQYEYTVRLIGQDFFGKDVDVPALAVTYNIHSGVAGASEGRDQLYMLPALPMRVMSLVPAKAGDIRDSAAESFAAIQDRLLRAKTAMVAAAILFGFSVLMLAFAVAHVVKRRRSRGPVRAPAASEPTLVRACLREVGRLKLEVAREGWTPERAGSALTVLRIGSAVAMGRPVAQTPMDSAVPAREGQLAVRKRSLARERIVVSAPTTTDSIARYHTNGNGRLPHRRSQALIDDLGKSLLVFSGARYGRNGSIDSAGLSRALDNGSTALQRLRLTTLWPMRAAGALAQSAGTLRSLMWTR